MKFLPGKITVDFDLSAIDNKENPGVTLTTKDLEHFQVFVGGEPTTERMLEILRSGLVFYFLQQGLGIKPMMISIEPPQTTDHDPEPLKRPINTLRCVITPS